MYDPARKKLGTGVTCVGRLTSIPGASRYSDLPSLTTFHHVQSNPAADGNSFFTCLSVSMAISSVDTGIHLSPGVKTHCINEPSPSL